MNGPRPSDVLDRVRALDAGRRLRRPGQHRHRRRRLRLLGRLPVARRGLQRAARGRRVDARPALRRRSGLPATAAGRAPHPGRRPARAGLPRLARQPDGGPADRPRPVGHRPARHPHRRPRHRLRPHARGRGARLRPEPDRQPGVLRLRLRRRRGRRLGAPDRRWRRARRPSCMRAPYDRRPRPPTRSAPAGCPATSTGRRRSAPGSSCGDAGRPPPRGHHRHGRGDAAGQRLRRPSGRGSWPASPASARIASFDPSRLTSRIAGEVQAFDPSAVLDRKEHAAQRPGDAVRPGRPPGRPWTRPACPSGWRDGWPRRPAPSSAPGWAARRRSSSRSASTSSAGRTGISPFFIPMAIANMAAGQVGHHDRGPGPELRHGQRLRHGRPRHRRGDRDDPPRRRRGDARRRHRGARRRGPRGRVRGDAGALHAQRRPGRRQPAVRPGPRRLRHRRGRRRARARGSRPRRASRGGRSWPRSAATARPRTPPTSRCPRRAVSAPCARHGGRWPRPASSHPRSTTSTPMPRARPRATRPSWPPSARSSASTRPRSASPPPRAPSATRSVPPAPSAPWPP